MFHPRRPAGPETAEPPPVAGAQNLRRFLAFARPYRWLILVVITAGVARFMLQFATPWGVGVLLDGALKDAGHGPVAQAGPRLLQVHGDRAAAPPVHVVLALDHAGGGRSHDPVDPNDVGAHVAQHHRPQGSGPNARQLDDRESAQRSHGICSLFG